MAAKQQHKLLRVREVNILYTTRGLQYKKVLFEEVLVDDLKITSIEGRIASYIMWPRMMHRIFDSITKEIRMEMWGDISYGEAEVGQIFEGEIKDIQTTEYLVDGIEMRFFRYVLFGKKMNVLKEAASQMRYHNYDAATIDKNGHPVASLPTKFLILSEADEEFIRHTFHQSEPM